MFYNATGSGTDQADADPGESFQSNIIGCAVATWVVAAVFVSLRFYLRGHLMKVLGREDWTILVSLFFSAGVSATFLVAAHYGLGKHTAAISATAEQKVLEVRAWVLRASSLRFLGAANPEDRRPGFRPCGSPSPYISQRSPSFSYT